MKETLRLRQFQRCYNYCLYKAKIFNPYTCLKAEANGAKPPKPKYKKETVKPMPRPKEKEIPITYEEGCYYESRILDWNDYGI